MDEAEAQGGGSVDLEFDNQWNMLSDCDSCFDLETLTDGVSGGFQYTPALHVICGHARGDDEAVELLEILAKHGASFANLELVFCSVREGHTAALRWLVAHRQAAPLAELPLRLQSNLLLARPNERF